MKIVGGKNQLVFRTGKSTVEMMKTTVTFLAVLLTSVLVADSKPLPEKAPPIKRAAGYVFDLYGWANPSGSNATAYVEARLTNGGVGVPGATIQFPLYN